MRTDGELLEAMGTDARKWAREFVAMHGGDEGLMIGWFANAIEAGRAAPVPAPTPTSVQIQDALACERHDCQATRDRLAELERSFGPDHIVDLGPGDWTMQHPLACRPDLLACPFNAAMHRTFPEPPDAAPGRYRAVMDEGGFIVLIRAAPTPPPPPEDAQ